jgi:protein-disulfide isomerase/uncharacterized membrane protein YphA (DoxX/SURF4 family)
VTWNSGRAWVATVLRLVIGALLFWAGAAKLSTPRQFTQTVRTYDITPEWLSRVFGYGLPVLELCLGLLLIVGITVRIAATVSALLFVAFAIALITAAARGIKVNWGAFNDGGVTVGATHYPLQIVAVLLLLAGSVYLVLWPFSRLSLEELFSREDYVAPPSAKRMRSEQGQRKYLADVAAKQRHARVRNAYTTSGLAIVVVLVSIIGIGVQSNRAKITGDPSTGDVSVRYGVVYGKVAAARVDIYEDFDCAKCLAFEQATRAKLEADVKANLAQVHYYDVGYLGKYSLRAANAAYCVADNGVDDFVKYHDILFGKDSKGAQVQPVGAAPPPTDAALQAYGAQAGLNTTQIATLTTCITGQSYVPLVEALTDNANKRGFHSVPIVQVNGKSLSDLSLAGLNAAIAAAGVKGPKPSPSPTPTPSGSKSASASPSATTTKSAAASSPAASPSPSPSG